MSVASAPAALRLGAAPLGRNSRSANNRGGANTFVVRPRRAAPVALKSRVDVRGSRRMTRAVAEGADIGGDVEGDADLSIVVDGDSDAQFTIVSIKATNRPGILQLMKTTLEDLGLSVEKTEVDMEGDLTADTFYVTGDNGAKVDDVYDLANIKQVIKVVLNAHYLKSNQGARPKDTTSFLETNPRQKDLLYSLMDSYAKNDVLSATQEMQPMSEAFVLPYSDTRRTGGQARLVRRIASYQATTAALRLRWHTGTPATRNSSRQRPLPTCQLHLRPAHKTTLTPMYTTVAAVSDLRLILTSLVVCMNYKALSAGWILEWPRGVFPHLRG